MKNKDNKNKIKNISCELHSNLMLITTVISMLIFVVLMLIYMGMRNPALVSLAVNSAKYGSVATWITAAALAYSSIKKHSKYYLEYIVYLIVAGFVLVFMFNVPFSMVFLNKHHITDWAHKSLIILTAANSIFFVVSVICHAVFANNKKN